MQNDRRNERRKTLNEPAEITFYSNGGLHFGSMLDLSRRGACFGIHMNQSGKVPSISKNRLMDCYITTKNGTSKCRSEVRWTWRNGNSLLCGIAFTHKTEDEDDPLAMTINRYFGSDSVGNRRYQGVMKIP
ncbi:MAG: PilZ domain-containing protein [Chitinispirillaceae bacterium]|nr:PilZ domain-containing protein [Chitinispirillaceae bacterium]